ncbi:DnaJ-like protein [Octadecabacter arcticus 238]|uniref:DnaJ-like protein n=1 Tax=Octadecabacter arcticus 238 TaxID=391616 RepID=M9RPZ0_9RHOB|nr:J domain-containing protein [Octadecabacter arcticus]AGI74262.1 DnaJ-like protein [Octadecabacter arcticus 238]
MFGIFKRLFGGEKAAGEGKYLSVERKPVQPDGDRNRSSENIPFEGMEREAKQSLEKMSAEMPGNNYFKLLEALESAIADRRYEDAADAARKSIAPLRNWLKDPRGDEERLQISIPALRQGGTMMAITRDRNGLEKVRDLVNEFEYLEAYRSDAVKHLQAIKLFERVRQVVTSKPGVLQNKMKAELGEEDGRHVSNLISWLEKGGEITRAKSGKTYALYMTGMEMSEEDASAIYIEPLRPCSHQKERRAVRARELDLNKLDLVPLPPSPASWSSTLNLPATSETFSDPDGTWRDLTVEAIVPADRPDPSFRKHFTTRDGVLSFDDLAKSKESRGAAGAAMFTPEAEGKPTVRSLKRPPYVLDVHPVGKGFASRSKANILTVYDEKLEVDFETDLSATPEVAANQKRFDLDGAGAGAVLWGEAHLALNCIALNPERDRYLYTHVDEAWCIDRDGKRLWGIRMPTRPVNTYSHTINADGIGRHVGTTSDIEQALGEMDLRMPITPQEIRQRYRAMVRKLHPDINPGSEDRMKTVNTAYETLTGASQDDLQGKGSAEDLLRFSDTITFASGGGPDRILAAVFSGSGDTVLLGTDEGRVLRIDQTGRPIALYDVGSAPVRILETAHYLYIQTSTRLYVLDGDRLVGLQDCAAKCSLLVDEGMVLLVEDKGVRVLSETGHALGTALTKAPIRRAGMENGVLVIETRTHRGRFSGMRE